MVPLVKFDCLQGLMPISDVHENVTRVNVHLINGMWCYLK